MDDGAHGVPDIRVSERANQGEGELGIEEGGAAYKPVNHGVAITASKQTAVVLIPTDGAIGIGFHAADQPGNRDFGTSVGVFEEVRISRKEIESGARVAFNESLEDKNEEFLAGFIFDPGGEVDFRDQFLHPSGIEREEQALLIEDALLQVFGRNALGRCCRFPGELDQSCRKGFDVRGGLCPLMVPRTGQNPAGRVERDAERTGLGERFPQNAVGGRKCLAIPQTDDACEDHDYEGDNERNFHRAGPDYLNRS